MRESAKKIGEDPDKLPLTYAKLINECIKDRPATFVIRFTSGWEFYSLAIVAWRKKAESRPCDDQNRRARNRRVSLHDASDG